jgi:hypothetical protein
LLDSGFPSDWGIYPLSKHVGIFLKRQPQKAGVAKAGISITSRGTLPFRRKQ